MHDLIIVYTHIFATGLQENNTNTSCTQSDLPPPAKRFRTDSSTLSSQIHPPSSVRSNLHQSPQNSTHQSPVQVVGVFLRSQYKRQKLPKYGKWPPIPFKQFINMAVILKEKVSRASADEFTKATIRGNPRDDILKSKKNIDFKHLAQTKDGESAQLVLVEGAPGIGKSTFAWEACRRWGAGEILQQYKLMVLLRLREKRVQQAQSVADLFYFKCDNHIKQKATQEIEGNHGAGLFLILEGFDELPAHLHNEESLFMDIIKGETLWNATIMLTSRHWASRPLLENDELHRPLSQHIEILGFTRNDIDDYLQFMTFDDPSVLPGLQKYLSCYPHIASMMYVPLNCAIVLEVYRKSKSNEHQLVPKTMTQLYSSLVRTLLLRYLRDQPEHGSKYKRLECFEDLPDSVYEQFCEMAKIAYEGICNDEQIIFSDLPDDFETLGLMQCVPELYVDQGAVVSYNFLHLTLQEFMAAVHVSLMTPDMQVDHFLSVEDSSMLLVFTAGLTKLNYIEKDLEKFKRFVSNGDVYETSLFHWLFEAQNAEMLYGLCKSISLCNAESDIGSRGPFDYFVLGYCVLQSNCKWDITFSDITNEETEMFVKGTTCTNNEDKCGKIKSLSLNFEPSVIPQSLTNIPTCLLSELTRLKLLCANDGWNSVFEFAMHTPLLNKLNLWMCTFLRGSAVPLFKSLSSLNSFTTLEIEETVVCKGDYKLYPEDYLALCMLLSTSQSLTKLMVTFMLQPDSISKYLIDGLNKSICLEHLNISHSVLSPKDVELLSSMLQTNHTLCNFNIDRCDIGSIGAHHLADGLNCNRTLKKLIMSFNSIGDDGAMALAQMLRINMSLTVLDISKCFITEVGVSHLADALCVNSSLETIVLDHNSLKNQGAIALAQMLNRNQSLRNLELPQCSITEVGVSHLADALCVNSSLETLNLNNNAITDQGAIALAQMLNRNQSLKKLKLKRSAVTEVEVSHLANALINSSLETIVLDHNPLKDQGAIALAQMLTRNKSLKELHLQSCSITQYGISHLTEALKTNHSITIMKLWGNSADRSFVPNDTRVDLQ